MTGGTGNDLFIVDSLGDVVIEAANGGTDTIQSVFTTTLDLTVENLVLTGNAHLNGTGNAAANKVTGNDGDNLLRGMDGNDTLSGGNGDDTLEGGIGNDRMLGGMGNDTYVVNSRFDVIVEGNAAGLDLVYASASYTMASGLETLIMQGSADLTATGNTSANTIIGNSGSNALNGGAGNDALDGGAGNDTLNGGTGNDSMVGGSGNDTYYVNGSGDRISESAGAGVDTVLAATHWTLGAHLENLTMVSTGSYRGVGNELDNVMIGNRGKNMLQGGDGDDTLNGGAGNDVLTGGAGADHFVFSGATPGNDTITDFNAVNGGGAQGDRLVFEGLLVGTFVYRGDAAFTGGSNNSEARFDSATDRLLIDTDGDGMANFQLVLTGMTEATQVTASDFLWS
jgi:Ca2+-binding RTX toxin-like protein